jgi:hypothetical protein
MSSFFRQSKLHGQLLSTVQTICPASFDSPNYISSFFRQSKLHVQLIICQQQCLTTKQSFHKMLRYLHVPFKIRDSILSNPFLLDIIPFHTPHRPNRFPWLPREQNGTQKFTMATYNLRTACYTFNCKRKFQT